MKVKVIDGNHPKFKKKADQILKIYNQESCIPFDESLEVTKPDSIRLIYIKGKDGGVIIDKWHADDKKLLFNSIMYAAFPENERRKGYLRACIERAGFPIETVQLDDVDTISVWKKLGFTKAGTLGFCTMLRSKDFENVQWGKWIPNT
ncbi:TPA: hypothetical protein NJ576_003842 [Vibrio parahaemolyticus]|nr:hypothetical protein [Vibrio parahaemolyticus]